MAKNVDFLLAIDMGGVRGRGLVTPPYSIFVLDTGFCAMWAEIFFKIIIDICS